MIVQVPVNLDSNLHPLVVSTLGTTELTLIVIGSNIQSKYIQKSRVGLQLHLLQQCATRIPSISRP